MTIDDQSRPLRRRKEGSGGNGSGSNASLSARLRAAREARGIDLFRVERDTKIRVKYLAALEEGDFSQLPGDVYVRGFLRNYASYLGMNPDEAEAEWRRSCAPKPTVQPAEVGTSSLADRPVGYEIKLPSFKLPPLKWPSLTLTRVQPGAGQTPPAVISGAEAFDPSASGTAIVAAVPQPPTVAEASTLTSNATIPAGAVSEATADAPIELRSDANGEVSTSDPSGVVRESEWRSSILPRLPRLSLALPSFLRRPGENVAEQYRPPEPVSTPARAFLLQPSHLVVVVLCLVIVGVGGFFAVQAQRVLQDPTLVVTSPDRGFTQVSTGTRTYLFEGTSTPKAKISVSLDQRTTVDTQADASGNWHYEVALHTGVNQIDIYSTDLSTNHKSVTLTRYLSVPAPTASPAPLYLAVDSPTNGETFRKGDITVTGSTIAVQYVTVTPDYLGPAPSNLPTPKPKASATPTEIPTMMPLPTETPTPLGSPTATPRPTPTPSGMPSPVQVIPTIDGKFSASLQLWSGTWRLTVLGSDRQGLNAKPVVLTVIVTAGSLKVVVTARGGAPGLKIWKDGKLLSQYSNGFVPLANGKSITIVADQSVWVATGIPKYTYVTVNGVSFGRLSTGSKVASWRMTAFGPPTASNDR